MHINIINGNTKLSDFRLNKFHQQTLSANEVYFIHTKQDITQEDINKLEQLLDGTCVPSIELNNNSVLVIPRIGTVSPWSSKATEISKRCMITNIIRIEKGVYYSSNTSIHELNIHDSMTESVLYSQQEIPQIFIQHENKTFNQIDMLKHGKQELHKINTEFGLALSLEEINYLHNYYTRLNRNPTDVELMMFAQANSEHCRHKIFNSHFVINDIPQQKTLFQLIRDTHKNAPTNVLVAYNDNSSVICGKLINRFYPDPHNKKYVYHKDKTHILMKVETHNHPTAISPFSGAATGSGGEIRDEGATGRGSKPKAGLCGFSVSNLQIPNTFNKWEQNSYTIPPHISNPLNIMLDAPVGAASFNNEFGRPNLCGYFRTFEQNVNDIQYGYHKPIMLAGGYGNISKEHLYKEDIGDLALIMHIGGSGFLIGLGGGSASSLNNGDNQQHLDFNSVQRANPEMQRRAQEVIDTCWSLGVKNPILSIHDVGAGGLSNALPELIHASDMGAEFSLRSIPVEEKSMSPMEIWCNESQERYVLAIKQCDLELFESICARENCTQQIVGVSTINKQLIVKDNVYSNTPINVNMDILLGKPQQLTKHVTKNTLLEANTLAQSYKDSTQKDHYSNLNNTQRNQYLSNIIVQILSHPSVASKAFLITIGDRSVGGYTVRDQMVGAWQIPVANCAITTLAYEGYTGEVMAIGEKSPIAILNAPASGRMAIAEAITNILSCYIEDLNDIKLSANWMASCGSENQDALLYETVESVSKMCQKLRIAIPVGKDSLSMKMQFNENDIQKSVISPISLVITAFSKTPNVKMHITPVLVNKAKTHLLLISLNHKMRMGASILQEISNNIHGETPDIDDSTQLQDLFNLVMQLHRKKMILAYHDRSDGGVFTSICEMMFAGNTGVDLIINDTDLVPFLFNEECGIIIQIHDKHLTDIQNKITEIDLSYNNLGTINNNKQLNIIYNNQPCYNANMLDLQQIWSSTSYKMQTLRDNPECAISEYNNMNNTGLFSKLTFTSTNKTINSRLSNITITRPKIAILREQGVNGHIEMAAIFDKAGFDAYDVHMNDIITNKVNLSDYKGLVACGGFSYGDVFGAGVGWANSILLNPHLFDEFSKFFARNDTFALGVCNGCQMMSHIAEIIPGAQHFPKFKRNLSEQFEARLVMVEIEPSPSILFTGMHGSQIPIIVSHGEGRAVFDTQASLQNANTTMRYIDNSGIITQTYPFNPNGSPCGIAALCNTDGRFNIMMPHPERLMRTINMSWHDKKWGEYTPWLNLFLNAYDFVK